MWTQVQVLTKGLISFLTFLEHELLFLPGFANILGEDYGLTPAPYRSFQAVLKGFIKPLFVVPYLLALIMALSCGIHLIIPVVFFPLSFFIPDGREMRRELLKIFASFFLLPFFFLSTPFLAIIFLLTPIVRTFVFTPMTYFMTRKLDRAIRDNTQVEIDRLTQDYSAFLNVLPLLKKYVSEDNTTALKLAKEKGLFTTEDDTGMEYHNALLATFIKTKSIREIDILGRFFSKGPTTFALSEIHYHCLKSTSPAVMQAVCPFLGPERIKELTTFFIETYNEAWSRHQTHYAKLLLVVTTHHRGPSMPVSIWHFPGTQSRPVNSPYPAILLQKKPAIVFFTPETEQLFVHHLRGMNQIDKDFIVYFNQLYMKLYSTDLQPAERQAVLQHYALLMRVFYAVGALTEKDVPALPKDLREIVTSYEEPMTVWPRASFFYENKYKGMMSFQQLEHEAKQAEKTKSKLSHTRPIAAVPAPSL